MLDRRHFWGPSERDPARCADPDLEERTPAQLSHLRLLSLRRVDTRQVAANLTGKITNLARFSATSSHLQGRCRRPGALGGSRRGLRDVKETLASHSSSVICIRERRPEKSSSQAQGGCGATGWFRRPSSCSSRPRQSHYGPPP